jgi:hypothetical protein
MWSLTTFDQQKNSQTKSTTHLRLSHKPLSRRNPSESPSLPTRTRSEPFSSELNSIIDSRSETQIMDNPSCLLCLLEGCLRRSLCFSADNSVEGGRKSSSSSSNFCVENPFLVSSRFSRFPCFIFDEWPKLSGRL